MSYSPTIGADHEVLTPTVQRFFRRALFWIAIVTILIIIAGVGVLVSGGAFSSEEPLSPDSPAPEGTKAVVEVLKQQGVDVAISDSFRSTASAIDDPSNTTLVINDATSILTNDQWRDAAELADTIVLLNPGFLALTELAPNVYQAGTVDDSDLDAGCRIDAATVAGTISGAGFSFQIENAAGTGCFESDDDTFSLVQVESDGATVTVLGATEALTNGRVTENGNAALALTLLGSQPNLVWYTPGLDDYDDAPATIADFAPRSVFPVALTLLLVFIAVAIWRGRRFGPLIVENLPVTVKASETMHGRARLYQHSTARLHAIDSLRIGTIDRLARLLGLPRLATVDEVVTNVAAISGRDEHDIRRLLVDAVPHSDRDLIAMSDELLLLEASVAGRLRDL